MGEGSLILGMLFVIYAAVFALSLIFALAVETFRKIDEAFSFNIIPGRALTPLESNINWFNEWAMSNNRVLGSVLVIISLWQLVTLFNVAKLI